MVLRAERTGDALRLALAGELAGAADAERLEAAWREAAGPPPSGRLELDLRDLEEADALGEAVLAGALRRVLGAGADVVVVGASQTLAHTLYKTGALTTGRLRLEETRRDEPYAG